MIEVKRRAFLQGLGAALGISAVAAAGLVPEPDEVLAVPEPQEYDTEPPPPSECKDRVKIGPNAPRLRGTVFGPLTEDQAIKCLVEMAGKREYPRIRIYPRTINGWRLPKFGEPAHEWYVEMVP